MFVCVFCGWYGAMPKTDIISQNLDHKYENLFIKFTVLQVVMVTSLLLDVYSKNIFITILRVHQNFILSNWIDIELVINIASSNSILFMTSIGCHDIQMNSQRLLNKEKKKYVWKIKPNQKTKSIDSRLADHLQPLSLHGIYVCAIGSINETFCEFRV